MNEDTFNLQIRKFLKKVGVTSQREIEKAVRDAVASGTLSGNEKVRASVTLKLPDLGSSSTSTTPSPSTDRRSAATAAVATPHRTPQENSQELTMASIQPIHPAEFSEEEWDVRCSLAACYRAFVKYGWTDLIYTHISARHPTEEGCYLINPYGLLFDEITASSLIVVDFDGNVVRGDHAYNDAGHAIHSVVLMRRPDVNWVLHSHTRAGMAVSCMKGGLLPLTQQAMLFDGQVSYHEYDHQTVGSEECEKLAADLGTNNAVILHNHGLLTCAPTVEEAFTLMYNLENACKVQVDVLCSRVETILPRPDAVAKLAAIGGAGGNGGALEWSAVVRSLERADPSFRT